MQLIPFDKIHWRTLNEVFGKASLSGNLLLLLLAVNVRTS